MTPIPVTTTLWSGVRALPIMSIVLPQVSDGAVRRDGSALPPRGPAPALSPVWPLLPRRQRTNDPVTSTTPPSFLASPRALSTASATEAAGRTGIPLAHAASDRASAPAARGCCDAVVNMLAAEWANSPMMASASLSTDVPNTRWTARRGYFLLDRLRQPHRRVLVVRAVHDDEGVVRDDLEAAGPIDVGEAPVHALAGNGHPSAAHGVERGRRQGGVFELVFAPQPQPQGFVDVPRRGPRPRRARPGRFRPWTRGGT